MTNTIADNDMVVSHITMRRAIGLLGMLLPVALLTANYLVNELNIMNNHFFIADTCSADYTADGAYKGSVSDYYYSPVGELFTGILIAVAIFLFCYKGHRLKKGEIKISDNLLTTIAGMAALGIVLFPTSGGKDCIPDNVRTFVATENTATIHYLMAAVFFISLGLMSIINFRRTDTVGKFGKEKHHNTFLVCGIGMLACIVIIGVYDKFIRGLSVFIDSLHPVFLLETAALIFFAISWLLKGKVDLLYIPKKLKLVSSKS
jgi:hypothetical protein